MLTIGPFSRLAGVSPKVLRTYDALGLFRPVWLERDSGYRYYSPAQLPEIRRILALRDRYGPGRKLPELLVGPDAATELAALECHTVLNGITGSIGLAPTLAALRAGRVLALANKESLIVGGPLVKAAASAGQVVPVDSEHSALFQALCSGARSEVRKLVVTASGGPFRGPGQVGQVGV